MATSVADRIVRCVVPEAEHLQGQGSTVLVNERHCLKGLKSKKARLSLRSHVHQALGALEKKEALL